MPVETGNYISDLNASYPGPSDSISSGDDHIRLTKKTIKNTFPNVDGPVELTTQEFADLKDGIGKGGVAASCKYNGSNIMYGHNIASVQIPAPGRSGFGTCRVTFNETSKTTSITTTQFCAALCNARGALHRNHQRPESKLCRVVVGSVGRKQLGRATPKIGFSMIVVDIFQG